MDVACGGKQRAVGLNRPTPVAENRRGRRGGSRRSTGACRGGGEAAQRRRHEEWDDTQAGEAEEALGDEAGGRGA
eukprot:6378745-Prymnesium_polylepis.1